MFHRLGGLLTGSELPWRVRESTQNIVWFLRAPRVLLGALVGAALTLSGVGMQAFTKNPLAEPYVLGISSGASLGAVLAMLMGVSLPVLGRLSVSAGLCRGAGVHPPGVPSGTHPECGDADPADPGGSGGIRHVPGIYQLHRLYRPGRRRRPGGHLLDAGRTGQRGWADVPLLAGLVPPALLLMLALAKPLNAMMMGDSSAVTLGVNLTVVRNVLIGVTALLTASSVAVSGCIGFVGLVIPHLVRSVVGPDHRKLVPLATLFGAIFLIWVDVGARIIKPPAEIPVGILTAFLGAPLFLWMIKVRRYEFQ